MRKLYLALSDDSDVVSVLVLALCAQVQAMRLVELEQTQQHLFHFHFGLGCERTHSALGSEALHKTQKIKHVEQKFYFRYHIRLCSSYLQLFCITFLLDRWTLHVVRVE